MYQERLILSSFASRGVFRTAASMFGFLFRCIFFPFGIYRDGTLHRARQRRLPHLPEESSTEIAGNGVPTTCCTPRHTMRKVVPTQFLRSFLVSYFPKSCCIRFKMLPSLLSRQNSIDFKSRVLKYLFYLGTEENSFFYFWPIL
jgi:hypothetical protein